MINQNFLKDKLYKNKIAMGSWNIIDSVVVVDIMASSGLDFVVIDSEHGPIDYSLAQKMVMACESRLVSPIFRVGTVEESRVLKALDIGAHGVQYPNIRNIEEVYKIVQYSKYPPMGMRGFSPYTRACGYSSKNSKKMIEAGNVNTINIVNIETLDMFDCIEEIASMDGIDVIFIGLYDLSKCIGDPGNVSNPILIDRLWEATERVHALRKKIGSIAVDNAMLGMFVKHNVDYITYSVDTGILMSGFEDAVANFRLNGEVGL